MASLAPPLKSLIRCVWDGAQEFVFSTSIPGEFYFQGGLGSTGSERYSIRLMISSNKGLWKLTINKGNGKASSLAWRDTKGRRD